MSMHMMMMVKMYGNFPKNAMEVREQKKVKISKMMLNLKVVLELQATRGVQEERVELLHQELRHCEDQQGKPRLQSSIKIIL
jgi:hypothetical protein